MIWRVLSTGWNLIHPNKSTTQIWVRICLNMEFLRSNLRLHFEGKPYALVHGVAKSRMFFTPAASQWNSLNTGREISYLRAAMSVMFYLLYKHQRNTIAVKEEIWCSHSDGNLFTCYRRKTRNRMFYFYLIWICRKVSSHLLTSYQTVLGRSKLEPP